MTVGERGGVGGVGGGGAVSEGFHFSYPAPLHKIYAVTPVLCLNFLHQYDWASTGYGAYREEAAP